MPKFSSRQIAFTAVFSALSVVIIEVVPGIPVIGASGSIRFDAALAPIYGLVIGPYLGTLAALIGGVVTAGGYISILTSFSTAISAFVAGMLTQKSYIIGKRPVSGWVMAFFTLALLNVGWYTTWVGQQAPFYPVLHLLGLLIVTIFRGWIATSFENRTWSFLISVCLACYCGIVSDHMLGNLIYIANFGIGPSLFMSVLPISVVERVFMTAISTVLAAGLVLSLHRAGLFPRESHRGPKKQSD